MAQTYVDAVNGHDTTGNGTIGNPWQTLTKALDTVTNGDTVNLAGTSEYAATMTSQAASRAASITVQPKSGDSPVLGTVSLTNVNYVKFSGLKFQGVVTMGAGSHDMTMDSCISQFRAGTNSHSEGQVLITGEGGHNFTVSGCQWKDMSWIPQASNSTNQGTGGTLNGPNCIVIHPASLAAPTDILIENNIARNLAGFDFMQASIITGRYTYSPTVDDWITNLTVVGNELGALLEAYLVINGVNQQTHSDGIQIGGYVKNLILQDNFGYGGTRNMPLILPNVKLVNNTQVYYGCTDGATIENNILCDATDSTLSAANLKNATIRHNNYLVASPSANSISHGVQLNLTRSGPPPEFASQNIVFANNIVNQIRQSQAIAGLDKRKNIIGLITAGYTLGGTDISQTAAQIVGMFPPPSKPRQVIDFLLTGGVGRDAADTGAAYTVGTDIRGYTRSGTKDIGALDVDASSGTVVASDTTPPTVSITSPLPGPVSGVVTLGATASDGTTGSGVAGVQFKVDGVNQGAEDLSAPYNTTWDTSALAANSSHTITAVARDKATPANTATSAAVTVTVKDVTPPQSTVTSPANGATINIGTVVSLAATASDNILVSSVQFTRTPLGGASVNVGSPDTSAPYTASWDTTGLAHGTQHVIKAVATDGSNNVGTSAGVTVTVVDSTPPTAAVTSPANAASVNLSAGTVTLTGTATDNIALASAQFTVDGVNVGSALTTGPFTTTWSLAGVAPGSHAIRLVARDAAGNVTTSAANSVTVVDNVAPSSSVVTFPRNGDVVSGTISLQATATDNVGVAGVQFKIDDVNQGVEDTVAPFSTSWNASFLTPGSSHTVKAVARDAAGNTTTSSTVTVTIADTLAPTVQVIAPAAGAVVSGIVSLTAAAADQGGSGLVGVQFKVDGVNQGAEDTLFPFTVNWDTTSLTPGSTHTITAVARDAAGNSQTSQGVAVTIFAPPPVVTDPPVATTGAASGVTDSSATLAGVVNPMSSIVSHYFDYGTTTSYGMSTPTVNEGAGSADLPATAGVSGLAASSVYHFRLVATGPGGTTNGADHTFSTAAPPAPPPPPPPNPDSGAWGVRL